MKKILPLVLATIAFSSNALASYVQNVETCLTVNTSHPDHDFSVKFKSSDVFDCYRETDLIQSGTTCVSHRYMHGPKNLKFSVQAHDNQPLKIILTPGCDFLKVKNGKDNQFESNYRGTYVSLQEWQFTLVEGQKQDGFDTYHLFCEHWRP